MARRFFALGIGGQPAPAPAGAGLRFVEAHGHHGFPIWYRLGHAEAAPPPRASGVVLPELGRAQPGVHPVFPPCSTPELTSCVAAVSDEGLVLPVAHWSRVDGEAVKMDRVRSPLVVQGPRLSGRTHR